MPAARCPRHRRDAGSGLQRRRHQLLFLRRAPAPSSLNRGDDLDTSVRHVTIPVNSHMTHTLSRSTRRPLTEGYQAKDFRSDSAALTGKAAPSRGKTPHWDIGHVKQSWQRDFHSGLPNPKRLPSASLSHVVFSDGQFLTSSYSPNRNCGAAIV